MKKILPAVLLLMLTLGACRKWQPENRIQGNWKLTDAESRRFLNFDNISTGYENGLFTFYQNGTAQYKEGNFEMTGNWIIRDRAGWDGENNRTELSLRLYNFQANRIIDWQFDNIGFGISGEKMRCHITSSNPNYRYLFERQ